MLQELDSDTEEHRYVQRLLEMKNSELRNKNQEHEVEIKKMKDLLHKEQNSISELKVEGVLAVKQMQDQSWKESQLHDKLLSLKEENRQLEVDNETLVKTLKLEHDEEITKLHNYYDRQEQEIEGQNKKMMQRLREQLDLRRKTEIQEINEQKENQMNALMKNHVTAFHDIKNHFNDIIMKLNEQIEAMKQNQKSL
ncbi:dynein regulatory complex subunit 4 [Amia ocellicauda]|uniref:dynein regulatory complex subunit 4 n=1 Tax=Amia ocellicauda TaxID=2972642 RepID=UPI00346433B2